MRVSLAASISLASLFGANPEWPQFRGPGYNGVVEQGEIPTTWDTDENIRWTRESYAALQPHLRRGRYVNYLAEDDTGEATARAAYGNNFDRLVDVKSRYDPTNLFRMNVNIPPRA